MTTQPLAGAIDNAESAIDNAESAIQNLERAITGTQVDRAIRDLKLARERLSAAMSSLTDAQSSTMKDLAIGVVLAVAAVVVFVLLPAAIIMWLAYIG